MDNRAESQATSAATIRAYLRLLELERLEAESVGLADCAPYITDLEDEIAECRADYVRAAVTEIAMLRSDISGPLRG